MYWKDKVIALIFLHEIGVNTDEISHYALGEEGGDVDSVFLDKPKSIMIFRTLRLNREHVFNPFSEALNGEKIEALLRSVKACTRKSLLSAISIAFKTIYIDDISGSFLFFGYKL